MVRRAQEVASGFMASALRSPWVRKLSAASVVLGSMLASYLAVGVWQLQPRLGARAQAQVASGEAPSNPFASANGMNLIAFVLTASDCGWSSRPATMEAVGSIRDKMRSAHGVSYAQISVVGVALDRDLDAGLAFLSDLGKGEPDGAFDQIMVGGSWLNEQIVRFVWREGITEAASPQVVVIERPVNTESYLATSTIAVQSDRLLLNAIGSIEIMLWIDQGVPLDFVPDRADSSN